MPIALFVVGLISFFGSILLLEDGFESVLDILETIYHDARFVTKLIVNRVRRASRMIFNIAIGLIIVYAFCVIGLIGSLIGQWTIAVIGFSIALTVIAAIFFFVVNLVTVITKLNGPSLLATLTLLPLPLALWAATQPFHFYEWLLGAYGILMIIGFALIVLGRLVRSTVFLGPYALTGILLVSGVISALLFIFPQDARAMVIDWKISNRDLGRAALAKEISLRTEDKVTAKKVYWWKVSTDSAGKQTASRYLDSSGKQCYSVENDVFKTIRSSADSIEVGQTLVQAYFPDRPTGEYMFIDIVSCDGTVKPWSEDELPWLAASGTTAINAVNNGNSNNSSTNTSNTSPSTTTVSTSSSTSGGKENVSVPQSSSSWVQSITVKKGDVVEVIPSGEVQARSDGPVVGPRGETSTGYCDGRVDSKYSCNVGGLEMGIGSNRKEDRILIDGTKRITAYESGVIYFRTIDKLNGFKGTGAFSAVVKKIK